MNLEAVVAQVRAYCPSFANRVAGGAEFSNGLEANVWPAMPAAFVVPLEDEASPNDEQNSVFQTVTERVGVVVLFDNSADRRGQSVTQLYDRVRQELFGALLNWNAEPERAKTNMAYAGGALLHMDRARLFYQWSFALEIAIDADDGFKPCWPPLVEIDANTDPGDPPFAARAVLPQPCGNPSPPASCVSSSVPPTE